VTRVGVKKWISHAELLICIAKKVSSVLIHHRLLW
jgi:hypothetical protein